MPGGTLTSRLVSLVHAPGGLGVARPFGIEEEVLSHAWHLLPCELQVIWGTFDLLWSWERDLGLSDFACSLVLSRVCLTS